jgi:hypothetical protein
MEFNSYMWKLYRNSEEGRTAIENDVIDHIKSARVNRGAINGNPEDDLREPIGKYAASHAIATINDAEKLFINIADEGVDLPFKDEGNTIELAFGGGNNDKNNYSDIFTSIAGLSAGLHYAHPEFFTPYLFKSRFDEFEKICRSFNIPLPQVPGKLQKRERALYYLAINRALYDFRKRHGLSPQELNAFLYDFAPKYLLRRPESDLPPPSRIWFVMGGIGDNGDFEYLDAADEQSVSHWQGNLETRQGDIILMWCVAPRSYLHSVWRALDEGFNDPFFYFYSLIRVGRPIKISPISFAEFSKHPVLGSKPAVRAHFQGASGTPFAIEDYAAICELLVNKGFDISPLPPPPVAPDFSDAKLENERDIEQTLVEPLLKNLGFSEQDWVRQFPLRMGRGERNYPDYVLGGDSCPGEERAVAVIECKLDIESKKEMKEAFIQAKSYALRLQSSVLALAARRGLWLFRRREEGFSIEHFTFKTWNELSHPDVLHEVSLFLGKRAIEESFRKKNRGRKKLTKEA